MKIKLIAALAFFLGTAAAKAQSLPVDTLGYRISVVSKVKDVMSTCSLSSQKQVQLADFFQAEETSINAAINNNVNSSGLQQLKDQLIAQFQSILSSAELASYRNSRKDSMYAKVFTQSN
jgi:hypothetical protein